MLKYTILWILYFQWKGIIGLKILNSTCLRPFTNCPSAIFFIQHINSGILSSGVLSTPLEKLLWGFIPVCRNLWGFVLKGFVRHLYDVDKLETFNLCDVLKVSILKSLLYTLVGWEWQVLYTFDCCTCSKLTKLLVWSALGALNKHFIVL